VQSLGRIALGLALALVLAAPSLATAADPFLRRTPTVIAVERVGPSVVNITTERIVNRPNPFRAFSGDPFELFFRDFHVPGDSQTVQSLGSGVIIDRPGHVITNEHVIARASRIRVSLGDGREFDATVVGADPNNDIAVLRIETDEELPWIAPGDSSNLLVGEPVIAIGNPFGLSNTVTTGVLSAIDRSVNMGEHSFHGLLQTDASINPGNSGGPLLNAEGSLIGISAAIFNRAEGIGFAIPIDVAMRVVAELIERGEVQPVWLGLGFQELAPPLREVMQLPGGLTGILLTDVADGSPGASAGLRRGDILTRLDGRPLRSIPELFTMLGPVLVGQDLVFQLWRDSELLDVEVTAEEIPDNLFDELAESVLGMKLEISEQGGYKVLQVKRGSGAAQIGIEAGDWILGINGQELKSEADFRRSLLDVRGRRRALVVVQRGADRYHVALPLS
jgi:S1-C subfamily serine protease